jgi:hypothetical protein
MGSRVKACSFLDFKKMSRKQFERYQNFYGPPPQFIPSKISLKENHRAKKVLPC